MLGIEDGILINQGILNIFNIFIRIILKNNFEGFIKYLESHELIKS